jgi:peptide chain release factor 2
MDIEHINAIGTLLADLSARTERSGGIFDYDRKSLRLNEVNAALENPAVWNEPKRAQELGKEKKTLEDVVGTIDHLTATWPTTPSSTR